MKSVGLLSRGGFKFLLTCSLVFTGGAFLWGAPASAQSDHIKFNLFPNAKFLQCFADPSASEGPQAEVQVFRGKLNDTLTMDLEHFKPGLAFDLFTVQRSSLLSNGQADPDFLTKFNGSFGLAWYQSDIEVNDAGHATFSIKIRTILLDQIFGFDPDVNLPPTNTFHVGFWFNDPNDAAPCGFDVTKPTPFNGEHKAGPLAMISVPDAVTGLGPLCTNPNDSTTPATCNP
jgi:hypothetical protein